MPNLLRSLTVQVDGPRQKSISMNNERPLVFMVGMNVLEDEETVQFCLEEIVRIFKNSPHQVIFKASFDKANRSSIESLRGPGLKEGLARLASIRTQYKLPILTDIHEPHQAEKVAEVADMIQIPAFLCRQTDLLDAACQTKKPLHIKKMQMQAPHELRSIVEKCSHFNNEQVILCERGTSFGYGNLVVDPLSFIQLKELGVPVSFDVTHALQLPGIGSTERVQAGGRSAYTLPLALAGVSQGLAAIFIECHPHPKQAWCDGACALPLSSLADVVSKISALDRFTKSTYPDVEVIDP